MHRPTRALAVSRAVLFAFLLALLLGGGVSAPAAAQALASLSLASSSATGGQSVGGTVALTAPAPVEGVEITLSSSNGALIQMPASVTAAEGATSAAFSLTAGAVLSDTTIILTATLDGVTRSATLLVHPAPLALFTVSPQVTRGGVGVVGRVVLGCSAPAGGALVSLASSNGAAAAVPPNVVVPAGATTASFPVATSAVAEGTEVALIAVYQSLAATTTLAVLPDAPLSLQVADGFACSGGTTMVTVKLSSPAPEGGAVVSLSTDYPAAAVLPDSVSIDAGATSAQFPVTIQPGPDLPTVLGISASLADATVRDSLILVPAGYLAGVEVSEPAVCAGRPVIGAVKLACPAPPGGTTVALSSSDGLAAIVPASVTVPAGAASATFPVIGGAALVDSSVAISASVGCIVRQTALVVRPILLGTFKLSAATVCAGSPVTGTLGLTCPAPAGGVVVTLTSDKPAAVVVPSPVTVPAGATSVSFPVTSMPAVPVSTTVSLKASYGGVTQKADLTVQPLTLVSLALSATEVCSARSTTGTVSLSCGAPPGGTLVALTSSKPGVASVPANVTVPGGATSAEFTVTGHDVVGTVPVTFTASYAGVNKTASLSVVPFRLATFTASSGSTCAGTTVTAAVTLTCPAPRLGSFVTLSSNSAAATVPASIMVPPGRDTATFEVVTHPVLAATAVTLKATFGGVTKPVALSVLPIALASLTLAPPSVRSGTASTGTVRLTCPAPAGGAVVALSSSNPTRATVPANVTVPEGATEVTFPISTKAGLAVANVTIKATRAPISKQATLIVAP